MTWDIVKIAVLVLAVTQAIKGWGFLSKLDPRLLSVLVTIVVVAGAWLLSGKPLDLNQIIQAIIAVLAANGGYKLLNAKNGP
jgi:hypothetical protein